MMKVRGTTQARLLRIQQLGPSLEESHIAFWKLPVDL